MNIRRINVEDTLPLRRDVLYPGLSLNDVKVENDADGLHFGVFEEGELVTVVSLFLGRESAQFRKLATRPGCQGKGYGKAILAHLAAICRQEKLSRLWCNARDTAVSFYEKLGYRQQGDYFIKQGIRFIKMDLSLDMSAMNAKRFEIIPAIDIIGGKCVRLTQGDYNQQKVYNEHPLEVAKAFEAVGVRRLHLVDLDGAKKGAVVNWKVLEDIAGKTGLVTDFGGGIKTDKDLEIVFESGAALATIGSVAVKSPELFFSWVKTYGADKIFLGADVKDEKIAVAGWQETTSLSIFDFLESNIAQGVTNVFCTDIAKDGLLQGPSTELYQKIIARFSQIHFIASGGVTTVGDIEALQEIGCSGAIIGKAIYEGNIPVEALKSFL
ncbi:1-(5-phosphoribosyl)-5-[(5-phosphoribosylamino)methylideneamino]imidazole-4-carboxamide isomerase [Chitinophaga nivalis]|uniref:1-(5-phosphoribosyl)-5-[(5-phosphoribosylamino)methylideneamino] imidazole-4-carboxamide isomerase n=1 Tax=Chitinophaga nivalis TaxID=2991709 RepID=A0ABT3IG44_9BACT|nr:1-(5-phosphoribosyl)-5-[(5-phosphoribosylamino)methylideneamino]imidazole-4-carboxamide isomerase [Chitinophaga nivalis]MCW3467569.1 1-(5-phosphoribosyl)-5-[(5-phosphoribosylamino)methylideneamino]imidazole-4-carboxamide isomerase [Chitinophaga nivalis]MCW3482739.1 1-(5-phosphoribosyl)-5-[(5-phosphoribosylamino)methylideneamino]imidazole-4-carboxamide isomerase [Chitinophaga nivalis]